MNNKRAPITMTIVKRAGVISLTLIGFVLGYMSLARADAWPTRPITPDIPVGAGTTSDIFGRGLAQALSESLGQPVVVENKGGAGGNIGGAFVAHAASDG